MRSVTKTILRVTPYIVAVLSGISIYCFAVHQKEDLKSLLINISAAFIGIPLIFVGYDTVRRLSENKLNVEINDYVKVQIDKEILGIINRLMKYILPYDRIDKTPKGINEFMNITRESIVSNLRESEFLGFQLLKHWDIAGTEIKELLKNALVVHRLGDNQLSSLIKILKYINYIGYIYPIKKYILFENKVNQKYRVLSGQQLNSANSRFPDRYILLKILDHDEGTVTDFGDFAGDDKLNLLKICKIQAIYIDQIANDLFEFIEEINNWLRQSGNTLLYDPRFVRFRYIEDAMDTN